MPMISIGEELDREAEADLAEQGKTELVEEDEEGLSQEGERQEEGEEGREPKGIRAPQRVSQQEREEHERTHTPFRAWCRHCVRGRGKNTAHKKRDSAEVQEAAVPRVSMDYFFMSEDDRKASENPIFTMVDEETGEKYARAVGQKGLGEHGVMDWLIKDISAELKAWGHSGGDGCSLIMKTDGEPAIVAVREAVAKYHGGRVIPEAPAKGESPSNGLVEEAGKTSREFTRVLKDQLECKAKMELKIGENIVLWMIRWAAMMCSRYLVGKDGRTAYERRRGRRCKVPVVAFGETVWYKKIRESKDRKDKFNSEWEEGIWLGHARSSNEAVIGTSEGVVRAYAIRRQDEEHRWSEERIRAMQGTPQQPDPLKASIHIPIRVRFDPTGNTEPIPSQLPKNEPIRRMRISEKLLETYGHTEGCEGCRFKVAGMEDKRPHTEACRQRIEAEMEKDDEGRGLKQRDAERQNHRLAEEMEREIDPTSAEQGVPASSEEIVAPMEEPDVVIEENAAIELQARKRCHGNEEERPEDREMKRSRGETSQTEAQAGRGEVDTDITMELRRLSVDVMEMYSPPRVTLQGEKCGLKIGEAMDLTTGWDFRRLEDQQKALKYIDEYKPKLVIGSPMCTMFSTLQNLTAWTPEKGKRWVEARSHMKFMVEVYRKQLEAGRFFFQEHPARATSWGLREIRKLAASQGVFISQADQCMYGLNTWGPDGRKEPAQKRTRFMTNSQAISHQLRRKCPGAHRHQQLLGGRAQYAARYPEGLCKAICQGLMEEKRWQDMGLKSLLSVCQSDRVSELPDGQTLHEEMRTEEGDAWDDLTGEALDPEEVRKARRKELEYIHAKPVWTKIPRSEARRRGIRVIKARWIDINKGDIRLPVYRSRCVGKEFNTADQDGLFASTPPLEALRLLISDAATGFDDKVIMINDVARAFFEAPMRRLLCVELPEEDKTAEDIEGDHVGLLQMSLYGTRDAAANFQEEVRKFMSKCGFVQGKYNTSTYYNRKLNLKTMVHGDYFITVGSRWAASDFRRRLEERF